MASVTFQHTFSFSYFPQQISFDISCRQFSRNGKSCFLGKTKKYFKIFCTEIFTQNINVMSAKQFSFDRI